ncbi:MAG: protein phosphatase 2C domain-containing protein [Alphaproteobacteria bacterium]|nr:protein phosphatase 2C domain-containing protein [Alphaproteobacteria bacterium]
MRPTLGVVCTSGRDATVGRARRNADNYVLCANGRASWLVDGEEKAHRSEGHGVLLAVADGEADTIEDARTASTSFCRVLEKLWQQHPAAPAEALADFLASAHTRMYWKTREREVSLGASGAVAWLLGDGLHWVEIGSARVFLWRNGALHRLAKPWVAAESQRFIAGSDGLGDDTALHLKRGTNVGTVAVAPGDLVLLSTDGLWSAVDERSMEQIVQHVGDAQTAAVTLMERAVARGGRDHVTVAVADLRKAVADQPAPPAEDRPLPLGEARTASSARTRPGRPARLRDQVTEP